MPLQFSSFYKSAPSIPPIPAHLSHWNPNIREYAVKYSGHGYPAVWRASEPPKPDQWMNLQDARRCAFRWCSIADTIGGNAEIIHMPTSQNIGRWY
jgi:hypothetical protein